MRWTDWIFYLIAALIVAWSIYWIARRIFRKNKDCCGNCSSCPYGDSCKQKKR